MKTKKTSKTRSKKRLTSMAADAKVFLAHMDGVPLPRGYHTTTRRFPPTATELRKIRMGLGISREDMKRILGAQAKIVMGLGKAKG